MPCGAKALYRPRTQTTIAPSTPTLYRDSSVRGVNQLWVSDLTYIRLAREWIYLAVILDAWSRRCIGWALDRHLDASLAVNALDSAPATRPAPEGLVHHSDRGVQYASKAYVDTLEKAGIRISMSRHGNPYDNAKAERFIRTLKYEEVYLYEYESLEEARSRIGYFIDKLYNRKRLHSALDYRPPAEFEQMTTRVKTVLTGCPILGCTTTPW